MCPMVIIAKAYHAQNNCHKQPELKIKKNIYKSMPVVPHESISFLLLTSILYVSQLKNFTFSFVHAFTEISI